MLGQHPSGDHPSKKTSSNKLRLSHPQKIVDFSTVEKQLAFRVYKVIYLYILKCNDDSFYVGVTNNLSLRLKQHNEGLSPLAYTYSRRPVKLVYQTYFTDFKLAFEMEAKIKKWSRDKKQALIDGRLDLLPLLSKKKF